MKTATEVNITPELMMLFERDEAICWLCNGTVTHGTASRDHVIPRSLGGPNNMENYKLAHRDCNSSRGNNESLPSKAEVVSILTKIQNGHCQKCKEKKPLTTVVVRQCSKKKTVLRILCPKCGVNNNEKKATGFGLNKRIKLKKLRVNEKRVPMDMSVIDRILAFQVEQQDYARFHDINGALHSGLVLNIDDLGDEMEITLSDDEDGDAISYKVKADQTVELLGYNVMAV